MCVLDRTVTLGSMSHARPVRNNPLLFIQTTLLLQILLVYPSMAALKRACH